MDVLARRFEVIYYDQRGSGHSPVGDPDRVTLQGSIDDLNGLRQGLGIDRLNLVGHSFGADLAVCYAGRHPDRVASLVVASPGPPFTPDLMEIFSNEMQARGTDESRAAIQALQASPSFAERDPKTLEEFHRLMYQPFFRDPEASKRVTFGFTRITADNVLQSGERMFRDLGDVDPIGHLAEITCPTLVLYAELDPLPEAFSRQIANGIPSAEFRLLEGLNHFAYMEDPEPFFDAVIPFLEKNAR
jgi:proline iminopeptidase